MKIIKILTLFSIMLSISGCAWMAKEEIILKQDEQKIIQEGEKIIKKELPIITVACNLDKYVPDAISVTKTIASIVDPMAVAAISIISAEDQKIHPIVVAACQKILSGSKPVVVTKINVPIE